MLSYTDVWDIVNRWQIQMRVTRLRNLTLLVYGIIRSRSGCLSVLARSWPVVPFVNMATREPCPLSSPMIQCRHSVEWLKMAHELLCEEQRSD